jgi:hypothetical protein
MSSPDFLLISLFQVIITGSKGGPPITSHSSLVIRFILEAITLRSVCILTLINPRYY